MKARCVCCRRYEMITYENATKDLTVEECKKLYEKGVAIEFNDGKDATFVIEKEPQPGMVKRLSCKNM